MRANLIKYAFLALSCLTLTACKSSFEGVQIAPELEPYVASYIQEAAAYGKDVQLDNVKIEFASFEDSRYLGVCKDYGDYKEVFISDVYLQAFQAQIAAGEVVNDIKKITDHELGHCLDGRAHKNTYTQGRPESVMNAYALDTDTYEDNYVDYMGELHTQK